MITAHVEAVKTLLETALDGHVSLAVRLDSQGVALREKYAILMMGGPRLGDDRFRSEQEPLSRASWEFTARWVAPTSEGVLAVAELGYAALVGVRPTVAGRQCTRIRSTGSDPVLYDKALGVSFADDRFSFESRKA